MIKTKGDFCGFCLFLKRNREKGGGFKEKKVIEKGVKRGLKQKKGLRSRPVPEVRTSQPGVRCSSFSSLERRTVVYDLLKYSLSSIL